MHEAVIRHRRSIKVKDADKIVLRRPLIALATDDAPQRESGREGKRTRAERADELRLTVEDKLGLCQKPKHPRCRCDDGWAEL